MSQISQTIRTKLELVNQDYYPYFFTADYAVHYGGWCVMRTKVNTTENREVFNGRISHSQMLGFLNGLLYAKAIKNHD